MVANAYFIGADGKGALRTINSMTLSPSWPGLLIGNLISMKGSLQVRGMWCWFSRERVGHYWNEPKWPGESWNLRVNFVLLHFLQSQARFNSMLSRGWLRWLQQYWLCRHNLKSMAGKSDPWKMRLDLFKNQRWTFQILKWESISIWNNVRAGLKVIKWGIRLPHYKSEGNRAKALELYKHSSGFLHLLAFEICPVSLIWACVLVIVTTIIPIAQGCWTD